jgi:hypothetical protein
MSSPNPDDKAPESDDGSNSGDESEDGKEVLPEPQEAKKKPSRSSQFSGNEILLLARAWIQVSTNSITSNNQKDRAFWLRVQQQQNSFAGKLKL